MEALGEGVEARPYLSPPTLSLTLPGGVLSCSDVRVGSGGGSVGWGWRSLRVAAAGTPHPPLSDRRESLLDSLKNKSHK